jgi:hypothetical protein
MRRDRRTFLQRFSQGPVAAPRGACHPWRRLVFEVARSPASPLAPVRRWPFGRSRRAVHRHRRQLHGLWMPGHAPRPSRVPVASPPHLGLAFGVLAEPSRVGPHLAVLASPSSPGTSSLAVVPAPDVPVNVHSRRSPSFGRRMPLRRFALRPRGFSPPRRFPPFTAPGMLQPVPGLGSPGFCRVGRRSRSFSGRVLRPRWRSTLRRFPPRRQPCRIAAACSPLAVRRLDDLAVARQLRSVLPARPARAGRCRGRGGSERLDPCLPSASFPSRPPGSRTLPPPATRARGLGFEAPSVRPRAGCPVRLRDVRRIASIRRSPGCGLPTLALLAETSGSARVGRSDGSRRAAPRPRPRRSIARAALDPESARASLPSLAPLRWWPSAPPPILQGSASIASCPRSSENVALCPRSGRLQGLAPPASPCPAPTLPPALDQFLPWVCFPFEASPPHPRGSSVSRGSDPASGPRRGRGHPFGVSRRTAGGVCPGVGAATVAGHGLPGVLDVKERLVRTWGSRPSPEGGRLSPLRRS